MLYTGALFYSEDMQTMSGGMPLDEFKHGLEMQMLAWERVPEISKDPTKGVKWHWTAKHRAGNDDRVITLLMMWWSVVFYAKPRYADFIRRCVLPRRMNRLTPDEQAEMERAVALPKANVVGTGDTQMDCAPLRLANKMGAFNVPAAKRPYSTIAAESGQTPGGFKRFQPGQK